MISAVSTLARSHLQLFKPETVLAWQRKLISKGWTYPKRNPGRRPVKLGIDIHHTTVNRIIQNFRKRGRIAASGSWLRFLKAHWDSLYGMDFMTIDTIPGKRFYLLIVLKLSTREIKYWELTEYPTKEFVRQRIIEIQDRDPGGKCLIHDNALQFTSIDYPAFGIEGVRTSVAAPNMNAIVECVIGTIRRETFDHFLLVSERQVRNIISKYVIYYNRYRPHQGIGRIPAEEETVEAGIILKMPILSGLHGHYYRSSA
jgi:putative transposase